MKVNWTPKGTPGEAAPASNSHTLIKNSARLKTEGTSTELKGNLCLATGVYANRRLGGREKREKITQLEHPGVKTNHLFYL